MRVLLRCVTGGSSLLPFVVPRLSLSLARIRSFRRARIISKFMTMADALFSHWPPCSRDARKNEGERKSEGEPEASHPRPPCNFPSSSLLCLSSFSRCVPFICIVRWRKKRDRIKLENRKEERVKERGSWEQGVHRVEIHYTSQ